MEEDSEMHCCAGRHTRVLHGRRIVHRTSLLNLTMKDFENEKVDYHFGTEGLGRSYAVAHPQGRPCPEIWPLIPVRHQETQQQPSTLDSTAPCFHLGRTTGYHLHSRVVLEHRRLCPSLLFLLFILPSSLQHLRSDTLPQPSTIPPVAGRLFPRAAVVFSIACSHLLHRATDIFYIAPVRRPLLLLLHLGYFFNHCSFSFCIMLYLVAFCHMSAAEYIQEEDDTWNERSSQRRQKMIDYSVPLMCLRKMEGAIYFCQYDDNKENIPPCFSNSNTTDNKLSANVRLKNKNKNTNRKPLNDITNLIVDSFLQSPSTSFLSPRLQSRLICRSTTANCILIEKACCKSFR
ncbi:hypothetical protein LXL04_009867 [Taraxacum kok-saghyz]